MTGLSASVDIRHESTADPAPAPRHLPTIAYLVGRYPALSHTFILREVRALRRLGVDVVTLSIHRAIAGDLLAEADRQEFANTYAVLPARWRDVLEAHAAAARSHPRRYLRSLRQTLARRRPGCRGALWQAFYFVEGIVVWKQCVLRGVTHIHTQFANQATDAAMVVSDFTRERAGAAPSITWSLGIHGPDEFSNVAQNRLAEKAEDALFATCISNFARSQLMALVSPDHWPKFHLVRCGVDPAAFAPTGTPESRPRGTATDTIQILSVGRLVPVKGHALLLRALATLRAREVPARLVIVGDGPERERLERLTAESGLQADVVFTGPVGQDEIRSLYAAADIFCLASFAEGVPVVLMEAMAMGKAVVATRIMGIPELVEHSVSGVLVPPGRADDLAGALEQLADDAELRERLGRAGRDTVRENYDVSRSAPVLRDVLARYLAAEPT